ncbi:MAG: hypothetical protein PUK70_06015 [Bacteroidales bacterium]|nr:hypothetical protein [Bacteroidales bacterium]MDY6001374.1 hypothetical protein [Candidatus Cryptobacteroides sp.]
MDKENVNADYQRIKQVMNYLNFSSDKRFAETIDVSPQNLYDIKAGKKGITHFIADSITKKFPQLSKSYIMLGEGEMLVSAPLQNIQGSNNHHNNGSDARYIAHLEAEIEALRKEKEELWTLVQKLTQR